MGLKRIYMKDLERWNAEGHKKALLVTGARQIGKTYLIREFGKKHFKVFAEINFITEPEAMKIFDGNLDAKSLRLALTAYLGYSLPEKDTLLFLDEIQECPRARMAVKFLIDQTDMAVIESGSLLGVRYKEVPSYPVGSEEILMMYPLDFYEFCLASGVGEDVISYLRECYEQRQPVSESVHATMLTLFRYYMMVGGMPAVAALFVETHDMARVLAAQRDILALYRLDIGKYALDNKIHVREIFDRIPDELEKKNRRFKVSSIKKTARFRDYEDSFMWLKDAGVAFPCCNVTAPVVPLRLNEQASLFKLFLNDTGLLCGASLGNVQFAILQGNFSINAGSILENLFADELVAGGFDIYYFNKRNIGEIDFLVQKGSRVIPLEIKSGKDYHAHKAIDNLMAVEEWNLQEGLIFCMGNVEQEGKLTYLPWYMIQFFRQDRLPESMIVPLDLSGLKRPQ